MSANITRRELLAAGSLIAASAVVTSARADDSKQDSDSDKPFGYCLNMSTIRGQNLTLPEQVEVAAKAGYDGIEPWMDELRKYADQGGKLDDLRKKIADAGLTVESAIGFAEWIVDDDARRAQGLEQAKRDMELLKQIGGHRIAAPPSGATKQSDLDLLKAAERYHALLDAGESIGVVPQLELWGFSQSLHRLGELMFVAIESGHPQACVLPDVYHIYKGGSDFAGLRMINGRKIHVFHVNDYPAQPDRSAISDAHRVYPGDGVAPLSQILRDLREAGFRGMLSLELFNRDYWKQDALTVAQTGLQKIREAVRKSLS